MPTYVYKCNKCEYLFETVKPMKDSSTPEDCPECGGDSKKQFVPFQSDCFENPRWSEALGVMPDQIEEAQKIHPGATFRDDGAMLIKNRKEKLKRLKERGWIEYK